MMAHRRSRAFRISPAGCSRRAPFRSRRISRGSSTTHSANTPFRVCVCRKTVPVARVNGRLLWFEDTGGDGPAVIFSHGFLMDREMFADNIAALVPAYRCVSWDQRGFGRTGAVDTPFTYWDSARDLLGLLDHLGIERA